MASHYSRASGPPYYVQALYSDGTIAVEYDRDTKARAIAAARDLAADPTREWSRVRVICEGELVWETVC